jgi:hypothetical protein
MKPDLHRNLKDRRAKAIHKAVEFLQKDDFQAAGDHLRRFEIYDRMLSALPRPKLFEISLRIIVALICVTVAGLVWTIRIPETNIILNIKTSAVDMDLSEAWIWKSDQARLSRIRIEGLSEVKVPTEGLFINSIKGNPRIKVDEGNIKLVRLSLKENSSLLIENGADCFTQVYAKGIQIQGEFEIQGNLLIQVSSNEGEKKFENQSIFVGPETISFYGDNNIAVPAHLSLCPKRSFAIGGLKIKHLSFSIDRSDSPGAEEFVSSILEGKLELSDISKTVSIDEGVPLTLKDASGLVTKLLIGDELSTRFMGKAKSVQLGFKDFDRNLTPTYLEYFYHKQRIKLYWSALVLLWGLLWSMQKILFR